MALGANGPLSPVPMMKMNEDGMIGLFLCRAGSCIIWLIDFFERQPPSRLFAGLMASRMVNKILSISNHAQVTPHNQASHFWKRSAVLQDLAVEGNKDLGCLYHPRRGDQQTMRESQKGEWQTTEVTRFIKTYKKLKSKFDGLEYKVAREIWELKDLMAKKDEYTTHLVEDQSWMLAYNTLQTKVMGLKASLKDLEEYAQVMVPNRVRLEGEYDGLA
ncbi:hypothetical protein HAX54_009128 [Datura stramonium]|uniref:Uncharacterized protein n=1 Tax=Datura stramonium TaxID=4076 RepID=A0ABS8TG35_DATST|nr:hypothetical protein [Datura stramonium]